MMQYCLSSVVYWNCLANSSRQDFPGLSMQLQWQDFLLFKNRIHGSDGKESACNVGDLNSILELGRSLGKGVATHSSFLAWRIP